MSFLMWVNTCTPAYNAAPVQLDSRGGAGSVEGAAVAEDEGSPEPLVLRLGVLGQVINPGPLLGIHAKSGMEVAVD